MERFPVFARSGHCQELLRRLGLSSRPGNSPESEACQGAGAPVLRQRWFQEADPTEEPVHPSVEATHETVRIELPMDAYSGLLHYCRRGRRPRKSHYFLAVIDFYFEGGRLYSLANRVRYNCGQE